MISTPAAIASASPPARAAGFSSRAARRWKRSARSRTIAFDKTGTLTRRPARVPTRCRGDRGNRGRTCWRRPRPSSGIEPSARPCHHRRGRRSAACRFRTAFGGASPFPARRSRRACAMASSPSVRPATPAELGAHGGRGSITHPGCSKPPARPSSSSSSASASRHDRVARRTAPRMRAAGVARLKELGIRP